MTLPLPECNGDLRFPEGERDENGTAQTVTAPAVAMNVPPNETPLKLLRLRGRVLRVPGDATASQGDYRAVTLGQPR